MMNFAFDTLKSQRKILFHHWKKRCRWKKHPKLDRTQS